MVKKCNVCSEEAGYKIKDTSDFYCRDCATEHFSDLSLLLKMEEEVQKIHAILKEKLQHESDD